MLGGSWLSQLAATTHPHSRGSPQGRRLGTARHYTAGPRTPGPELMPDNTLGVIATVPTLASPLRPLLYGLIRNAKYRIRMTMAYFAPDDELISVLCDAAGRGVAVELMFGAKSDAPIMLTAARAFYSRLFSNGVKVYERQFVILHAKTMLVDDVSLVGSTNLDYRSIEFNCEISAVVRDHAFDHDKKYAEQVDQTQLSRRTLKTRIAQWAVTHVRQLL